MTHELHHSQLLQFPEESRFTLLTSLGLAVVLHCSLWILLPADRPSQLTNRPQQALMATFRVDVTSEVSPRSHPVEPSRPRTSQQAGSNTATPRPDHRPSVESTSVPAADSTVADTEPAGNEGAEEKMVSSLSASDWGLLNGGGSGRQGSGSGGLPGRNGEGGPSGLARSTTLTARNLSRDVRPPDLEPWVKHNFPTASRMARVEGTATVSAIVRPSGKPSDVRVEHVDPRGRGFGEACSRTVLEGPAWQPRLNRDGRPVPARVRYTCRFTLPEGAGAPTAAGPTAGASANRVWTRPAP